MSRELYNGSGGVVSYITGVGESWANGSGGVVSYITEVGES